MTRRHSIASVIPAVFSVGLSETFRAELAEIEPEDGWRCYKPVAIIREVRMGSAIIWTERFAL